MKTFNLKRLVSVATVICMLAILFVPMATAMVSAETNNSELYKELITYSANDISNIDADVQEYGYIYDEQAAINAETTITANDIPVPSLKEYNYELVTNGNFDDGKTGWSQSGGSGWVDGSNAVGKTGASYYSNASANGVSTNVTLEAGKTYTLTFYHKGTTSSKVNISENFSAAFWGTKILDNITTSNSNESSWTKYTKTFTSTYTGTAQLWLINGGFQAWFDGVSLIDEAAKKEATKYELVTNGSFEEDFSKGWGGYDGWGFRYTVAKVGSYGLYIKPDKVVYQDPIAFEAGREYTLSFYYKSNDANSYSVTAKVSQSILPEVTLSATSSWQQYTVTFTSAYTGNAVFYFGSKGNIILDDVSITTDKVNVTEHVTNGNFDDGKTGWSPSGSGWVDSRNVVGANAKSFYSASGANGLSTNVTLEAGKEYTLTFWHMGSTTAKANISTSFNSAFFGGGDVLGDVTTTSSSGDKWTKYTKTFTPTYTGTAQLWLKNYQAGQAWFDGVSLVTKEPIVETVIEPSDKAINVLLANTATEGEYVGIKMTYTNGYTLGIMDNAGNIGTVIAEGQNYVANDSLVIAEETALSVTTAGGKLTVNMNGEAILTDYEGVTTPVIGACSVADAVYSIVAAVCTDKDNYDYLGDLNGDMKIDLLDLIRAKKVSVGAGEAYNAHVVAFNENGTISADELALICEYIIGERTDFTK